MGRVAIAEAFDIPKSSEFEPIFQKQGRSRYQVFAPLSRAIALPIRCPLHLTLELRLEDVRILDNWRDEQ
uniref:hypothetical protein n=1 Tax=Trichocoleus desertorum TaxID=1481672 RepID=UPI0025B373CB|nr:hypothetical protein [Trichocoleus desertorum]